jgi:hypothetical protein
MDVDSSPPPQSRHLQSYIFREANSIGFSVEERIFHSFKHPHLIFERSLFLLYIIKSSSSHIFPCLFEDDIFERNDQNSYRGLKVHKHEFF